jgi:hypothetical protein
MWSTRWATVVLLTCLVAIGGTTAGNTAVRIGITYQGKLVLERKPVNGRFDFRFRLFDAPTKGTQVASTVIVEDIVVTDGLVAVCLDFGPFFAGNTRWLEVELRRAGGWWELQAPPAAPGNHPQPQRSVGGAGRQRPANRNFLAIEECVSDSATVMARPTRRRLQ